MAEVKITGVQEAAAAFDRLAEQIEQLESLDRLGETVAEELADSSPYRTGRLAGSWTVTRDLNRLVIGSDLVYAAVQNYGSSRGVVGLHFVDRAAELAADQAGELITDELDQLIDRM